MTEPNASGPRWIVALACTGVVVLAVLAHLPSLHQPLDRDMAAHATIGALATEGLVPYRDVVDNKQPLPYVVYAAADAVAPRSTLALRLTATAVAAAGGVAVLLLTQRRLGVWRASVAAALTVVVGASRWVQGVDLNTEHLLVVTGALAVLVPWRWAERPWAPVVGGILLGLAALTKAPGALFVLPALVALLLRGEQRGQGPLATVAQYAAGTALPVAVVVAGYAAVGAADDLVYWNLTYNLGYVDAGQRGDASPFTFNLELWPVLGLALVGAIGALYAWRWSGRRDLPLTVLAWLAAAYAGAKLGGREFPHYYAPLVAPAALGVALALPPVRAADRPRRVVLAGALVATVLALPALVDLTGQYGRDPDELAIDLYRETQAVPWTYQDEAGDWLAAHADRCDELFVAENEPGFYWASGLRPATPYLFDGHVAVRPDFWDELAARLAADPPRWLVFPRSAPIYHPYLEPLEPLGYRVVATFGPVHVLELPGADDRCENASALSG